MRASASRGSTARSTGIVSVCGSTATSLTRIAAAPLTTAPASEDGAPIVSRLAGHAKLGRIVARFIAQLPDKLAQMDHAARRGDFAELAALAHWLKGAGGSMGYDNLYEPSKALEVAARGRDAAAVTAVMTELQNFARRIERGSGAPQNTPAEVES